MEISTREALSTEKDDSTNYGDFSVYQISGSTWKKVKLDIKCSCCGKRLDKNTRTGYTESIPKFVRKCDETSVINTKDFLLSSFITCEAQCSACDTWNFLKPYQVDGFTAKLIKDGKIISDMGFGD